MKAPTIMQIAIGLAIAALSPTAAQAQRLSGGTATPAASSAKAGGIVCTYRIGKIGLARVSTQAEPGAPAQASGLQPQAAWPEREIPATAKAYPNPFADEIRVTFAAKEDAGLPDIQFIDQAGKIISPDYHYTIEEPRKAMATIKAASLPSGKYIIRILTGGCAFSLSAIKI